ncbi:MAG: hypothetical protein EOP54_09050 [Sphingobacteriales bacterium]|nr:MAG: hypothetical protein EOP54_09050 [Sphingobacteriales bacterium]
MKKLYYTLLCGIMIPAAAKAQRTGIPAPKDAKFVLEYNLPFVFSQTTAERLNLSEIGSKVYEELFLRNKNYESEFDINKSGIDHSRKAYLHMVNTDSIEYTVRLLPVQNMELFRKAIGIDAKTPQTKVDKGIFYDLKFKDLAFIPNTGDYAVLVATSATYNAFDDSARAERWGIEYEKGYGWEEPTTVETIASPEEWDTTTEVYAIEAVPEDFPVPSVETVVAPVEAADEAYAVAEAAAIAVADTLVVENDIYDEDHYPVDSAAPATEAVPYTYNDEQYEGYQSKKDSIFTIWKKDFVTGFINEGQDSYSRLQELKDFEAPKQNSAATFYMNNLGFNIRDLYGMYGLFGISRYAYKDMPVQRNENWSMIQLNFETNAIHVSATSRLTKQMAESSNRIYKRKFNKKFNNYINSQADIGVMGMAMNTKNYLEETPVMVKEVMNSFGLWTNEASLIADLFGIVVDEKATGKVIWGDGAFVMTNVKEKEYQSIRYKWDEETYESTEEEETEKEMLPNFLMMFSTKNEAIIKKLLDYGLYKGAYEMKDDIYFAKKVSGRYDPFEYFCTVKDGIVFIGTELQEVENIRDGKKRGSVSASDKKLMRKNAVFGWFHPKKLVGKFGQSEDEDNLKMVKVNNMLNSLGVMQFNSGKVKNNKVRADFNLMTPNSRANSFEYLMYLIDDLKHL